jgi:undecaprenyl diphosphate synthase
MSQRNSKESIVNMPNHVVIIPDGNRRWAKKRGLESWKGHKAGAENTEKLLRHALKLGIKCLSMWGSSHENLQKRPLIESRELLKVYEEYFVRLLKSDDIHNYQVKINFIGDWEAQFPNSLKKILYDCASATKNYTRHILNFFLAYSGDDEMVKTVKAIAQKGMDVKNITKETIKRHLLTKDLPAVDYMIRTGGEPHLSAGFMMWDTANAQLYFSEKFFPDFGAAELEEAVNDFSRRGRRLGK